MNATQLLAHFDRLAEAPDAVPRLRRFILDLAVRGKLVEQDVGDEPAAELLERIKEEKLRLANEGLAKKEKPLPAVDFEERPFSIPNSWRWARLQDITSYIQRGKSPNYATSDGVPVVSQKCVQWRGLDLSSARLITRESLGNYEPIRFLRDQDLLWNSTGTGTIGRIVRVISTPKNLVCDSHVTVVRCALANSEYVRSWLATDHVYGSIEDRAAGATNQVELNSSMAAQQVVPFPPLAEQHRIVAKVDELMALCDQLEAAQQERERRRDRLAAASLQRLNQPAADTIPEAQREHARFHLHHLPRLTTRPEHIKAIRQAILGLAVRGKLVEQAVDAEPASALLKRLQADIKSYGVQNRVHPAAISAIPDSVTPYPLPGGWIWTRLASLCRVVTDGDHLPPPKSDNGVAFLTIGNVSSGVLSFANSRYVSQEYFDKITPYRKPELGDILYTVVGASYGRPVLVETDQPFCVQRHIAILKPASNFQLRYLHLLLKSQFVYDQATASLTGTAQPTIPLRPLRNFLVPLPPLAEQHRIVAKVNELMALCDQLEAQLTTTKSDSRRLLEAVLDAALTPPEQ